MSDAERLARRLHELALLWPGWPDPITDDDCWENQSSRRVSRYLFVAERLLAEYEPKCDAPTVVAK